MTVGGWSWTAFASAAVLTAAYLGEMNALVLAAALIVAAGSLLAPQRTGPFPFLAFLGFCLFLRDSGMIPGGILPPPDKTVGPLHLAHAAALALYALAACEVDALKHGIRVRRRSPLPAAPPVLPGLGRATLWGAWAWLVYTALCEWGPAWIPELSGFGMVRAGTLIWLLLAANVVGGVVLGVLELGRADRLAARMFVQESLWRPHHAALKFLAKMVWRR